MYTDELYEIILLSYIKIFEKLGMDIKDFTEKSQEYLSRLFFQTTHNLSDENVFGHIQEPVKLSDNTYSPYFFKALIGYEPSEQVQLPVLYTFFILAPSEELKGKFLSELNKKNSGQEYDGRVITDYYLPLVPGHVDFDELINDLTNLLELNLLRGRGYKFSFHLVCPTPDYNFALIFLEANSVLKLLDQLKDIESFDI